MVIISFIFGFVLYILYAAVARFSIDYNKKPAVKLVHATTIEII
jgi:heme/copper-type cytochrome/quinol oxidase subunit 2